MTVVEVIKSLNDIPIPVYAPPPSTPSVMTPSFTGASAPLYEFAVPHADEHE